MTDRLSGTVRFSMIHAQYMDEDEVYHTILHEIGHALGLGHSPYKTDIMYTPHQKGVKTISKNDKLTLKWLYILPQGATPAEVASKYGANGSDIDEIVKKIINKQNKSGFEEVKQSIKQKPERDLEEEQERIALMRKHHMALQHVTVLKERGNKTLFFPFGHNDSLPYSLIVLLTSTFLYTL